MSAPRDGAHGATSRAAPLAGVAVFGLALAALVAMVSSGGNDAAVGASRYPLLREAATTAGSPPPMIAATPQPAVGTVTAPPAGDAGIWSTPAEFAPPE